MLAKRTKELIINIILICLFVAPILQAQDHPDDIYWDYGFSRHSGTSSYNTVYDIIIYNKKPIICGRLGLREGSYAPIYNILTWDNEEYLPIDTGIQFYGRSMVVYKGKLIGGGHRGGDICIAEWDGFNWSTLDTGLIGNIEDMVVLNDSLFVGGWFQKDSISYEWYIAVWDGNIWGKINGTFNGKINSLATYNDQLIVGGEFTSINLQNFRNLAKWNGTEWVGIYGHYGNNITHITTWDTNLVIVGELYNDKKVGYYNNQDSLILLPNDDRINDINDLIIYNNQITISTFYADSLLDGAAILTWDGTQWNSIGTNLLGYELSMESWNDSLFVSGKARLKGQLYYHRSALWDGSEWSLNYTDGLLGLCHESILHKDQLVVAGWFDYVGNETSNNIGMYDGADWTAFGYLNGMNLAALYSDDENLYVGGDFSEIAGINANSVAMWDGTNWHDIGFETNCLPRDFIYFNNKLIISGHIQIDSLSDTVTLAYRENDLWVPFEQQPNEYGGIFEIYKDKLIMAGNFDSIGTTPAKNLAMWDGENWTALITSFDSSYSFISSLSIYHDTLVVTGYFNEINGVTAKNVAFWDGVNWSGLNYELGDDNSACISTAIEYNDQLVLGGHFESIGGVAASNIAIWDGDTFSPLGSGITTFNLWDQDIVMVYDLQVYNNELYVLGEFFIAGGKESHNIARWTKESIPVDIIDDAQQFIIPKEYELNQNYPNPFNPTTEISFTLPKNSIVTLEIFNILGQKVSTLVDGYKPVGSHSVVWDASNFASGIYLYRLTADEFISEKKMVLVK